MTRQFGICLWITASLASAFSSVGCNTEEIDISSTFSGDTNMDENGDTDTGSDADTNGDSSMESDEYLDTDFETDFYVDTEVFEIGRLVDIMPDENGWLDRTSNSLNLQGAWYTFGGGGSDVQFLPQEDTPVTLTHDGSIMFQGVGQAVTENAIGDNWGAAIGFNLCTTRDSDESQSVPYPLGGCPFNSDGLAARIVGFAFELNGNLDAEELRITFSEGTSGSENAYASVPADSELNALIRTYFKDASVGYDSSSEITTKPENVVSVFLLIPTSFERAIEWRFEITGVFAIVDES